MPNKTVQATATAPVSSKSIRHTTLAAVASAVLGAMRDLFVGLKRREEAFVLH
jgi:hypothetical protein